MFYIGIDVSKNTLDLAYRTDELDQAKYLFQCSNDQAGFEQFVTEIEDLNLKQQPVFVTIEPTGGYEGRCVHHLLAQGWQVALPNPKFIKDFGSSRGRRSKTDRVDAKLICEYGFERKPNTHTLLSTKVEAMRDLLQRKSDLEKLIRSEKNRQKQYQQRPRQTLAINASLEKIIELLEQEIEQIDHELKEMVKNDWVISGQIKRLLTLPGVGPKIVCHLFVHLALCHTLTDGKGKASMVVAMAGLDPQAFQSGISILKSPHISKKGNKLIREKLFMGALGGVSGNNPLKDFYQRLIGRGKAKKKALVAAMRKILVWGWAIFIKDVDFDPALAATKS